MTHQRFSGRPRLASALRRTWVPPGFARGSPSLSGRDSFAVGARFVQEVAFAVGGGVEEVDVAVR